MADDDAAATALAGATPQPQPVPNPDAQATVNDFLDYTEFFPADLLRSLRLIGDLDAAYTLATRRVHDLTQTYGRLPALAATDRPNPVALRKHIAAALDKATYCRESTYAEAARLYEVAERHTRRLAVIKTKLQAQPQPPSRDPTPAPVSPQAQRSAQRPYDRYPRLHLHFDGGRHGATASARPRDRKALHRRHSTLSDSSSDSDRGPSRIKIPKERAPRPPRARPSGSSRPYVGISTSHALALLSPPPPDAKPGSKHAPWFKLTEYEMAVLRKHMKKNAQWTPSDTMIRRELDKKQRGHEYYEKEKARCEATGEEFLDEEPYKPSSAQIPPPASYVPNVRRAASANIDADAEGATTPFEFADDASRDDVIMVDGAMKVSDGQAGHKVRRESQREQAIHSGQKLEDAARKIQMGAENLKELHFASDTVLHTPVSTRRASLAKQNNKRKRESSASVTDSISAVFSRAASQASHDGVHPPEAKRLCLPISSVPESDAAHDASPVTPEPTESTSRAALASALSPTVETPDPALVETSMKVPLAPAGPSTPKVFEKPLSRPTTAHETPDPRSPMFKESTPPPAPPPVIAPTVTAASSRPRRESAAPIKVGSPPPAPAPIVKLRRTPSPVPEEPTPSPAPPPAQAAPSGPVMRPRSARGHVPTPKAQSEEPKPNELSNTTRELRRHSIFSQSALAAPTRVSTRRKPPPKGDVTSASDGPKTVSTKRSQGSKNKRRKKTDEEPESMEDIDPDEPHYCICDDVSHGEMIQCDNNCEKEWFHFDCVGMTIDSLPSRRGKWYCPDCRKAKHVDAYGKPLTEEAAPAPPSRRGNR